ncbi:hypothetical protein [Maribacter sp. 2210JD10-5]|uniref:hypothetical protein n=1 Tax=Maribacter sp. 2210JD10-5 TaxID=3386272 RepID=UPI0039BCC5F5
MGKYFFLIFLVGFLSCDDGDLQIETLDFDSIETPQFCGDLSITEGNVLFKINGDEALIVTLASGLLKNEVNNSENALSATTSVTYRIFSDNVSTAYFCDEVPPVEPTVMEEIVAENGMVLINTMENEDGSFTHEISLSGISLILNDGSRITDLTINDFGSVSTTP